MISSPTPRRTSPMIFIIVILNILFVIIVMIVSMIMITVPSVRNLL